MTAASAARRYRVFISYRHGADSAMAVALARTLTRFARPWYQTRAMRVFLDQDSLAAQPEVKGALNEALAQSDWLLLLASPGQAGSAGSPWVAQEVAWWLQHRGRERLIIARTGGEIVWDAAGGDFDWAASSALTPALRGAYPAEPLWADFTAAAAAPPYELGNALFRNAFLTVAAAVHGRAKDALWSIEQEQQRRRVLAAAGATAAVALFALGAYNQWTVSMDRKQNLASIQLGAKAFSVLHDDAPLAAQLALAGIALRPSGIAASALRSAVARLDGAPAPSVSARLPGAVDIVFSPDTAAARLAVLRADGTVTLIDVASGRPVATVATPAAAAPRALAWGHGGMLAVAGADGVSWGRVDPAAATAPALQRLPLPAVRALAFSADGQTLALAHADGTLRLVAVPGGATLRQTTAHPSGARAVAFNGDGTRLASGGEDGMATLWDADTLAPLRQLRMAAPVASVDFNRDGSSTLAKWMLAVTDVHGAVRVIDADGPAERALDLPGAPALAGARFVASGRCLALAGGSAPLQVLGTLGFEPLFTLGDDTRAHTAARSATVAMATAATHRFATLDAAGTITVHDQPLCGDAEAVCRFAEGRLTARLAPRDRLRWLPPDDEDASWVQQPPGCDCCRLITRVLGGAPGSCR